MGSKFDTIGIVCIAISLVMQVFSSLFNGTGLIAGFSDLPSVDGVVHLFQFFLAFIVDLCTFIFTLVAQTWADHFWVWLHFLVATILDLGMLFVLAERPVLLILAIIGAVVGGIFSFFHL